MGMTLLHSSIVVGLLSIQMSKNAPIYMLLLLSVFPTLSSFEMFQCIFVHPELYPYNVRDQPDNPKCFVAVALPSCVAFRIIHVKLIRDSDYRGRYSNSHTYSSKIQKPVIVTSKRAWTQ